MFTFYYMIYDIVDLGDNLDDTLAPNMYLDWSTWIF
jgi:hypothetical protein